MNDYLRRIEDHVAYQCKNFLFTSEKGDFDIIITTIRSIIWDRNRSNAM